MSAFTKAIKRRARGRVALIGPAGSGKSYTMLVLGRTLAGATGRIAAVDTEHGSLSKYAHTEHCGGPGVCKDPSHFDFDVMELDSFSPHNFMEALALAIKDGYDVFCCDSLSHFWMGKEGALEFVDMARKRSTSKDDMSGWKDFSPVERKMVDAMIAAPLHVLATMRTKTDYQEVEYTKRDGTTGKKRVKIGLAPVQRQGLEYEFDLVGYMDEDNNLIVDKTRCSALAGKVLSRPGEVDFLHFRHWLAGTVATQTQERNGTSKKEEGTPQAGKALAQPVAEAKPAKEKASKGGLPANGQELQKRLNAKDSQLAGEGVCRPGELVKHVVQAGVKEGYAQDLATWSGAAINLAVEETRAFENKMRQKIKKKGSAGSAPEPAEKSAAKPAKAKTGTRGVTNTTLQIIEDQQKKLGWDNVRFEEFLHAKFPSVSVMTLDDITEEEARRLMDHLIAAIDEQNQESAAAVVAAD